ncbi:MAG: helix-turn-helix transcriptional regulator [Bacteroidia bacterium]
MKHLRMELGISQQQLADHLKIPRSVISMAELGKRPYPEDYRLKIEQIRNARADSLTQHSSNSELNRVYINRTIKVMQELIIANNYQLYSSNFKLSEAKERLKKALTITSIAEKANQALASEKNSASDITETRINLANRKFQHKEAIEKMNIALLELKIKTLEFERDEAEKWVKENGG